MPLSIERNDLALVQADAVVVAANERLQITGGVGLSVARAAGARELQAACDRIGFCACGSAVATPAFGLSADVVVHAVGPVWKGGGFGEVALLRGAYRAALECATSEGARSIALPLLPAGTYGFPADVSLSVARESIRVFLDRHDDIDVRLVLYSRESVAAGLDSYLDIVEYIDDRYVGAHGEWRDERLRECGSMPVQSLAVAADAGEAARPGEKDGGIGFDEEAVLAEADYAICSLGEPTLQPAEKLKVPSAQPASLEELLRSLDASFSTTLLKLIDERGLTDAEVYKRANMSRQLFSKIRSDVDYRPTKKTALALAVALRLDLDETADFLARAGFALSASSKADIIAEYFISRGIYDIFKINEALYAFDQPIL